MYLTLTLWTSEARKHCNLLGGILKQAILAESGEGTTQYVRSLRTGEPRNARGKVTRLERVLFHMEIRTLNARRMFREKPCFLGTCLF